MEEYERDGSRAQSAPPQRPRQGARAVRNLSRDGSYERSSTSFPGKDTGSPNKPPWGCSPTLAQKVSAMNSPLSTRTARKSFDDSHQASRSPESHGGACSSDGLNHIVDSNGVCTSQEAPESRRKSIGPGILPGDLEQFLERQKLHESTRKMRLEAIQYWDQKARAESSHPQVSQGTKKLEQQGLLGSFNDRYEQDIRRRRRGQALRETMSSPVFRPHISRLAQARAGMPLASDQST